MADPYALSSLSIKPRRRSVGFDPSTTPLRRHRGTCCIPYFGDLLLTICRSTSSACVGSVSSLLTAVSMFWAVGLPSVTYQGASGFGLGPSGWFSEDVAIGDNVLAFLLGGFAQFAQTDVKRVGGIVAGDRQFLSMQVKVPDFF